MEGLCILLVFPLVVSCSPYRVSGSVSEVSVRPGDNITLYCDCRLSTGEFIVWYRNCSHENQPVLILQYLNHDAWRQNKVTRGFLNPIPRFHFVRNFTSNSYDLLIVDVIDTDEGLYYCGTERMTVDEKEHIHLGYLYRYGNFTRMTFNSSKTFTHHPMTGDCAVCWKLLLSLCPAFAVLSSMLSSILVYHFCQKTAKEPQVDEIRHDTGGQRVEEEEDVCYAAVEIHHTSQRPKKKEIQSSDFATYSAIYTYRV